MLMPIMHGENLFDDFFREFPFFDDRDFRRPAGKPIGPRSMAGRMVPTDITENEDGFEIEMELPGFAKEEIAISLEDGNLIISAAHNEENKGEEKNYIRRERFARTCTRGFYVGKIVTEADIKAEFNNGILKLNVPKKTPAIPEKKYIAIEG